MEPQSSSPGRGAERLVGKLNFRDRVRHIERRRSRANRSASRGAEAKPHRTRHRKPQPAARAIHRFCMCRLSPSEFGERRPRAALARGRARTPNPRIRNCFAPARPRGGIWNCVRRMNRQSVWNSGRHRLPQNAILRNTRQGAGQPGWKAPHSDRLVFHLFPSRRPKPHRGDEIAIARKTRRASRLMGEVVEEEFEQCHAQQPQRGVA